jgi:hypothetical protein
MKIKNNILNSGEIKMTSLLGPIASIVANTAVILYSGYKECQLHNRAGIIRRESDRIKEEDPNAHIVRIAAEDTLGTICQRKIGFASDIFSAVLNGTAAALTLAGEVIPGTNIITNAVSAGGNAINAVIRMNFACKAKNTEFQDPVGIQMNSIQEKSQRDQAVIAGLQVGCSVVSIFYPYIGTGVQAVLSGVGIVRDMYAKSKIDKIGEENPNSIAARRIQMGVRSSTPNPAKHLRLIHQEHIKASSPTPATIEIQLLAQSSLPVSPSGVHPSIHQSGEGLELEDEMFVV